MDRRGSVLILTASAGAGHLVAAQAIAEALRGRLADRDVEVIDVLERSTGLFRAIYARGYVVMVNRLPSLMGYLYRVTDRPGSGLAERARVGFQQFSNRRLMRDLPFAAGMGSRLCLDGPTNPWPSLPWPRPH